jgi:hypothetical protein
VHLEVRDKRGATPRMEPVKLEIKDSFLHIVSVNDALFVDLAQECPNH